MHVALFIHKIGQLGSLAGHGSSQLRQNVYSCKMADDELKQPLLEDEDTSMFTGPTPRQKIKSLYESDRVLGKHSPYTGREDGTINISASTSVQNFQDTDHIVSIFVVAFDTKHGELTYQLTAVNLRIFVLSRTTH